MKKLMIAAACAAVGLGAFAENTPEVYNMTITVKTTTCKAAQGKNVCDDDYSTFRVKATQKIEGVIWGCDCPTIAEPVAFTSFDAFGTPDSCHGYVFWDNSVKTKNPYETAEFVWSDAAGIFENFLQCINPKCTDVEGVWTLTLKNADDEYLVLLQGAGLGTAKWASQYNAAYIASMSGNVTGWAFPGSLTYGCAACGETYEGCSAWAFCTECEERGDDYPSAAYGSWSLKFNKGSAVKYGKGVDRTAILDAYNFPAAVKAYLIAKDAEEPEPQTDCAKAKAQLAALQKQLDTLETTYTDLNKEIAGYKATIKQCSDTNGYLKAVQKAAQDAYDYQLDATTNSAWAITYKNASGDLIEVKGNGLATFEAKVADLKHFTITDGYFYYAGMEVGFVGNEGCELFCKDQNETTATLKTALDEANAAVSANDIKWSTAKGSLGPAEAKLAALDYENTKAQLNTAIGAQTAVVINICGSL